MKKTIASFLIATSLTLISHEINAATVTDTPVTSTITDNYNYDDDGDTLTVSGAGQINGTVSDDNNRFLNVTVNTNNVNSGINGGTEAAILSNRDAGVSSSSFDLIDIANGKVTSSADSVTTNREGTIVLKSNVPDEAPGVGAITNSRINISATGTVENTANNGTAIYVSTQDNVNREVAITNAGNVVGRIVAISNVNLNNTGTIAGNVEMGNNSSSDFRNSGTITGNITHDSIQSFELAGGVVNGNITGDTAISVSQNSVVNGAISDSTVTIAANRSLGLDSLVSGTVNVGTGSSLNFGLDERIMSGVNANVNLTSATSVANITGMANNLVSTGSITGLGTVNFTSGSDNYGISNGLVIGTALQKVKEINIQAGSVYSDSSNPTGAPYGTSRFNADDMFINGYFLVGAPETYNTNLTINSGGTIDLEPQQTTLYVNDGFNIMSGGTISTTIQRVGDDTFVGSVETLGAANVALGSKMEFAFTADYLTNKDVVRSNIGTAYTVIEGNDDSAINTITEENITITQRTLTGEFGDGYERNTNRYKSLVAKTSATANGLMVYFEDQKPLVAFSNSQRNAYDGIYDSDATTGELARMQQYLDSYDYDANKNRAIQSSINQADNAIHRLAFDNNSQVASMISERLNFNHLYLPLAATCLGKKPQQDNVWGQVFGSSARQQNSTQSYGYNTDSFGVTFGADKEISNDLRLGAALSFADSKIKSKDYLKSTDVETFQGNVYGSYEINNFFVNSTLGFSHNRYNTHRTLLVVNEQASSKHNGQTYFAQAEAGYVARFSYDVAVLPTLTFSAAQNKVNRYSENGGGTLNLSVKERDVNFMELRAGTEIRQDFFLSNGSVLTPSLGVSVGYDFAGDKQRAIVNFVNENYSFETTAANISKTSLRLKAGLDLYNSNSVSLGANYVYEKRVNYDSHLGQLKASYSF